MKPALCMSVPTQMLLWAYVIFFKLTWGQIYNGNLQVTFNLPRPQVKEATRRIMCREQYGHLCRY